MRPPVPTSPHSPCPQTALTVLVHSYHTPDSNLQVPWNPRCIESNFFAMNFKSLHCGLDSSNHTPPISLPLRTPLELIYASVSEMHQYVSCLRTHLKHCHPKCKQTGKGPSGRMEERLPQSQLYRRAIRTLAKFV